MSFIMSDIIKSSYKTMTLNLQTDPQPNLSAKPKSEADIYTWQGKIILGCSFLMKAVYMTSFFH